MEALSCLKMRSSAGVHDVRKAGCYEFLMQEKHKWVQQSHFVISNQQEVALDASVSNL